MSQDSKSTDILVKKIHGIISERKIYSLEEARNFVKHLEANPRAKTGRLVKVYNLSPDLVVRSKILVREAAAK